MTALINSRYMKTEIHYCDKVTTGKGDTMLQGMESEFFNTFINGQFIFYKQHG